MALQKGLKSFEEKLKSVSEEICGSSNRTRKSCCCLLCLRIMEKICVRQSNLSSDIGDSATITDCNRLCHSLPLSAPSSQIEFNSRWKKTPDSPLKNRLKIRRSKSLDFNTEIANSIDFCQSREKKFSRHASTDLHYTHHTLGTNFKESVSNGSDSEDTLPDRSNNFSSENDNNTASSKLVENIQRKKKLGSLESSKEDVSNEEHLEIKQVVLSDDDDYSMPLFNYSQEDEFILIQDSDEEDTSKSSVTNSHFEESKDVGHISQLGNIKLEDVDTQPCPDFNDEIIVDQKQNQFFYENVQIEKTFTIFRPSAKSEVSNLSTSPKFMKNKLDNLNSGSFENDPMLVKKIKREDKSDSTDSEDLFLDEMESQATQVYAETEWRRFNIKHEKPVEKQDPLERRRLHDFAEHKNADSIKKIQNQDAKNKMSSSDEDDGLNECLADNGNRYVQNELKTQDDDLLCPTQIDSHSDDELIKRNTTLKSRSKIKPVTHLTEDDDKHTAKKRWKTTVYYDNIDSDDELFWCATQVDSNPSKEKPPVPNKEPFVLTDSDEDSDGMYMVPTQVDMMLERLSSRGSQSSSTFKPPVFSQAKASTNVNRNNYWPSQICGLPEPDSDSDESMFSVATQIDDPQPLNKYEDYKTAKTDRVQVSGENVRKKRKLKHKRDSKRYKYLNASHEKNTANSDSDDSIFSLATQIDNNDDDDDDDSVFSLATQIDNNDDDDDLFRVATQLDPEPLKSYKKHKMKPKTVNRTSRSILKANYDYDSDDSAYSVATQIDAESPRYHKSSKLCLKNLKSQNKSPPCSVITIDDESDSDSSVFSVTTQIDTPTYKRKCERTKDKEEKDDVAYCVATQVDTDIDVSVKKTKPVSLKDDVFKVPFFPKKRLKVTHQKDTKTVTSGCKETSPNSEAVDHNPFGSFLLGIAEGEMEKIVISPEKNDYANNSEETEKNEGASNSEETEKIYGKFLLDLSDVPLEEQSKPISQTCPVEPLRLKTKKEMRMTFKNQSIKDASNKSPEEKCHQKMATKVSPVTDTWLSKCKKPAQKKPFKEAAAISRNINEARNRLEERYFLSHLDPSIVGWNKGSHIKYGSSSTITDVQLPDEDEIRKKRLPLTEGPHRRRPLPDILTEHLPEEQTLDMHDPAVNTPVTTIEHTFPIETSSPIYTNISPKKSLSLVASTQLYKSNRLDTFKIPKLPNFKPKLPCDSVTQSKLDLLQAKSTEKCSSKHPTEFVTQQFQLKQVMMDETLKPMSTKLGYHNKRSTTQILPSCDSASFAISKQTNHPSKTVCHDNKNQYLQDRRIHSKNMRNIILKHLLKWNPKWLSEQKNIKTIPPIVKMDELLPLLNSYTSLEDYQSIFTPLLLLEIWESISKDFSENCHKNREWRVAFCNVQILDCLMDYVVYGVISVKDYNNRKQMMEGDIVKINLQVKNPQDTNTGNGQQNLLYPVMGIVDSIRFYDSQFHSEKLEQFPLLASLPEVKSKFKIYRAIIKTHYRKLIHAFTDLMSIELISTSITHLRQFQALMCLSSNLLCSHILNPGKGESAESGVDIPSTKNYNSSQLKAISAAACIVRKQSNQPSYCLVQGPPGTGKSHTIIGIINKIKEINKNCNILLCAPSNGAIDELTRRLIKERRRAQAESREPLKFVRIGNPDSINEDVSSYSLSELIKSNNTRTGTQKSERIYPELTRICTNEKKIILKLKDPREKDSFTEEQKRKLAKDLRNLQEKKKFLTRQCELSQSVAEAPPLNYRQEAELRQTILQKADVICSTLNTCGSFLFLNDLSFHRFDCIIIDEASQCTELDCLIPLQYNCCKLILFGDTEQLAPTVLSQRAAEYNYGLSLFERLCNNFKDLEEGISNPVIMLNCQYRMHPEICKFASRYIYENKLLSDTNLELRSSPIRIVPYLLFDIQHGQQVRSSHTGSLSNPMEAEFTVNLCEHLISLNESNSSFSIGIIAPYKLQKNLLQDLLNQRKMKKIEVTTVDGFQGREKDIIIMSCVRAQGSCGKIGFLTNRKRLNVALTRAKFALYIVGHLHSFMIADEDWKSLIEDAHQRKLVVPVHCESSTKLALQNCVKS